MIEFTMPILGADMEAGTLVAWRRQPGEHVERGEVIAEVETEKGLIEVEVFTSGVVEKILIEPGAKVPVGTVMALIREDAGMAAAAGAAAGGAPRVPTVAAAAATIDGAVPRADVPPRRIATTAVAAPMTVLPGAPSSLPEATRSVRVRASPAARKRAAELGVDLTAIRGAGPEGAIGVTDVERAAARGPGERVPGAAAARGTEEPAAAAQAAAPTSPAAPPSRADAMRRTIGAAMARSKREIPHYYLATTIDLQRALAWLEARNAARPVTERVLPAALLLKSVALALREVPELNGVWTGAGFTPSSDVHLGVAIALRGGGLVAPALHHADRLEVDELMRRFRDLVARARSGSLRSSELSQPTITVTSLGEQGVESVFGVIYPPQVAIVGFGKIVERPWIVGGAVVPRAVVIATLSADHRVSDGHRGARFLGAMDRLLQAPEAL